MRISNLYLTLILCRSLSFICGCIAHVYVAYTFRYTPLNYQCWQCLLVSTIGLGSNSNRITWHHARMKISVQKVGNNRIFYKFFNLQLKGVFRVRITNAHFLFTSSFSLPFSSSSSSSLCCSFFPVHVCVSYVSMCVCVCVCVSYREHGSHKRPTDYFNQSLSIVVRQGFKEKKGNRHTQIKKRKRKGLLSFGCVHFIYRLYFRSFIHGVKFVMNKKWDKYGIKSCIYSQR